METCPSAPAAAPPPKKQRTEEVTPPLISPVHQLSAEQQASREKQLEHVFELCARARPGSPMRAFLAQFHNRLSQGWSRFETMGAMQYSLSEEWTLLMRHAPWTPRCVETKIPAFIEEPDEKGKASPSKKRPPRGPRVLCCQWLKSNANRPVLEDACRSKKLEFTKKTTRFQLAQLLHPELPDFCENHEHKRR